MEKIITEMTVNELAGILAKHFNRESVYIEYVSVADAHSQRYPREIDIEVGGVLTLHVLPYGKHIGG